MSEVNNDPTVRAQQQEMLVTVGDGKPPAAVTLTTTTLTDYLAQYVNPDGSVGAAANPTAPSDPSLSPPALMSRWHDISAFVAIAASRLHIMDLAGDARLIAQQAALKNAENIFAYQMNVAAIQLKEGDLAKAKAAFDGAMEIAQGAVSIMGGALNTMSAASAIKSNKEVMNRTDPDRINAQRADDGQPPLTTAERGELQDNRRVGLDQNRMQEQMRSGAVNAMVSATISALKGSQAIVDGDFEYARLNFESEMTKLQANIGMEQFAQQTQQAITSSLMEELNAQVARNNKNDELQAAGFNK